MSGRTAQHVLHRMMTSPGWGYMPDLGRNALSRSLFERSNMAGTLHPTPSPLQQKAFDLLHLNPVL